MSYMSQLSVCHGSDGPAAIICPPLRILKLVALPIGLLLCFEENIVIKLGGERSEVVAV